MRQHTTNKQAKFVWQTIRKHWQRRLKLEKWSKLY